MNRLYAFVVLLLVASGPAVAQDYLRGDVFAGYSYLNSQTNGLSPSRQNFTGWESSYATNLKPWLAGEADFSGYYRTIAVLGLPGMGSNTVDVAIHDYSFLGGPRLNHRAMFFHALFGVDHLSGSGSGFSSSENSFAAAIGGGVQWNVSRYFALRTSVDYMLTHHNIFGGPATQQNNFRASVGVVYRFGVGSSPSEASHRPSIPTRSSPAPSGTISISSLGVLAKTQPMGVEIVEVGSHSAAEQAGLHAGDVINAVDGKPILSATDLATELSNTTPGSTIRVEYLIHGYWQTASSLVLQPSH